MSAARTIGKGIYAILFVVVIPYGLGIWSGFTADIVILPPVHYPMAGQIITVLGLLITIWGMASIYYFGKGLPMNAYPPKFFVTKGAYRLFKHPIYVGFGITLMGIGIWSGSASFLWLITPVTILCTIALVMGFESLDINRRFNSPQIDPLFEIVKSNTGSPRSFRRFTMVFLIVGASWITTFIIWFNYPEGNFFPKTSTNFLQDHQLIFGVLGAIAFVSPAIILKENIQIRGWMISSFSFLIIVLYLALILPEWGQRYLYSIIFNPDSFSDGQLYFNLMVPNIGLVLISAYYLVKFSSRKIFIIIIFAAIILSNLFIYPQPGIHVEVVLLIYLVSINLNFLWQKILSASQYFANAWKEWIIGPVRIINHGLPVSLGAFFGTMIAGILAGTEHMWGIFIYAVILEIFSGLWAQLVEGSEKLKRPFGYYGGLVGIFFAGITIWLMGYNAWLVIAACAVVAPWIQAAGRVRCLINGCCHGKPTEIANSGIRYFHERSRVLTISKMKGIPLHPTQVYSIVWLFLCGFVLLSFWNHHLPFTFISGMYLVLTSTGRFVEEAYRGEVQTKIYKGLRLYQWTAIAAVLAGIVITCIKIPFNGTTSTFSWQIPFAAFLLGVFTFFIMGVDFPRSNARFSRLV